MAQVALGLAILAGWAAVTFGVRPDTGWIHVLLIAGVVLVIRGIVGRDPHDA
jgi:hypothetical protein